MLHFPQKGEEPYNVLLWVSLTSVNDQCQIIPISTNIVISGSGKGMEMQGRVAKRAATLIMYLASPLSCIPPLLLLGLFDTQHTPALPCITLLS